MRKNKSSMKPLCVLFSSATVDSMDMFSHCVRIPDIMARMGRAREVFQKYQIPVPLWLFGLVDGREIFDSPVHLHLISFLMSLGFYDRLLRLYCMPRILIGRSTALLVATGAKMFEKAVLEIYFQATESDKKKDKLYVFRKKPNHPTGFSSLDLGENESEILSKLDAKYRNQNCVLILPSCFGLKEEKDLSHFPFVFRDMVKMDTNLSWFWPILRRRQLEQKNRIGEIFYSSPFSDNGFK